VGEVIEKSFDIGVENDLVTLFMIFDNPFNGLMTVAFRTEPVGGIMEEGFEDRLEKAANHLLSHTIPNGRDAQRTEGTISFIQEMSTQREGLEGARLEFPHEGGQVFLPILIEELDADLVDARCPAVAFDRLEGSLQEREGDLSGEGMSFWILSG
jgi:hypothetical protein